MSESQHESESGIGMGVLIQICPSSFNIII